MKAVIDLSEVEDQLKNCKPGDEYSIVFTVDQKTDTELDGTASEIEHLGEDDSSDGESEGEGDSDQSKSYAQKPGQKRVPKAILMVAK